jgi:hypothetical protein
VGLQAFYFNGLSIFDGYPGPAAVVAQRAVGEKFLPLTIIILPAHCLRLLIKKASMKSRGLRVERRSLRGCFAQSAPGMAIRALSVGRVGASFPGKLLMAAFAVFMKSDVQLPGVALSFRRIMAGGALLDRLAFMPDILTVFIFMVALLAGFNVSFGVFQV